MAKIYDAYYNQKDGQFYGDTLFSKSRLIVPNTDYRYRDIITGKIFIWDEDTYRDHAFFQTYSYYDFKNTTYIKCSNIFLAAPGHRLLGILNGIDESSA